jgi:hypothetical protein
LPLENHLRPLHDDFQERCQSLAAFQGVWIDGSS